MQDARPLYLTGAIAGALVALAGLFWPGSDLDTGDLAAARVNGHAISRHDLDLALEAMARDSRNPLPEDAELYALSRLIDEELLFQRALELELPRNASTIRRSVVIAMIDSIIAQADRDPTESELRTLFDTEGDRFSGETLLRIDWRSGPADSDALTRPAAHPPDRLISASDLRRYLGEELALAALTLDINTPSDPILIGDRRHQLTLLERSEPGTPRFERHREAVEALWRERAQEEALEAYLAELRARADIAVHAE